MQPLKPIQKSTSESLVYQNAIVDQSTFGPTPLSKRTARLNHGNKWHAWAQYHIPDQYEGLACELRALHERVVLEDKSPMHQFSLSGMEVRRFLDYMLPRDVAKIEVGQAFYTPWLDDRGKVVLEAPVFRWEANTYVNIGGLIGKWLEQHASQFDVEIKDISDAYMVMPLQGPKSLAVLEAVTKVTWEDLKFMRGRRTRIGDAELWIWRVGYASTRGYEIHCRREDALRVYDAVMQAGEPFDILNIGQNAVQVARTEAGIILPGLEYSRAGPDANIAAYVSTNEADQASPFELGLGALIDFDKGADFIGKHALLEECERGGAPRQLVGLEVNWRDIADLYEKAGQAPEISRRIDYRRHTIRNSREPVGKASSMCWSPTLRQVIAMGVVRRDSSEPGTRLSIDWSEHGTRMDEARISETVCGSISATVVELPFIAKTAKFV